MDYSHSLSYYIVREQEVFLHRSFSAVVHRIVGPRSCTHNPTNFFEPIGNKKLLQPTPALQTHQSVLLVGHKLVSKGA